MLSQHYITFPFYIPHVIRLIKNWPHYLFNYISRNKIPAEYRLRNGLRIFDAYGTLPGTVAVVFIRKEYGDFSGFRSIVDIGANMGAFSLYASLACPKAKIFCYEPEANNFIALKRNIKSNNLEGRVFAYERAVAVENGVRKIYRSESPIHTMVSTKVAQNFQKVTCTTLPDIFAENRLEHIDLMKMNCEGAEYEILKGCDHGTFRKICNFRLEYHNLDKNNNSQILLSILKDHGYIIQRFTRYRGISGFIWACRNY